MGIILIGFAFGLYYLVGGDFDYETPFVSIADDVDIDLSSFNGCVYYLIETLLGQQSWEIWHENISLNMSQTRARIIIVFMLIFSVLGCIILLNLIIAIMNNLYDKIINKAKDQNGYEFLNEIYRYHNSTRILSAPFNVIILGLVSIIYLFTFIPISIPCFDIFWIIEHCNPYDENREKKKKNDQQGSHKTY